MIEFILLKITELFFPLFLSFFPLPCFEFYNFDRTKKTLTLWSVVLSLINWNCSWDSCALTTTTKNILGLWSLSKYKKDTIEKRGKKRNEEKREKNASRQTNGFQTKNSSFCLLKHFVFCLVCRSLFFHLYSSDSSSWRWLLCLTVFVLCQHPLSNFRLNSNAVSRICWSVMSHDTHSQT